MKLTIEGAPSDIRKFLQTGDDKTVEVTEEQPLIPVTQPIPAMPHLSREQIVAAAKNDIEKLKNSDGNYEAPDPYFPGDPWQTNAEFIVNREKRAVTVLLKGRDIPHVYAKGVAKCAPGEVFNAYIGKAIALRRALGKSVPEKYLHAPQPENICKGDVLENGHKVYAVRPTHRTYGEGSGFKFMEHEQGLTYINEVDYERWTRIKDHKIVDDTDREYKTAALPSD